MPYAVSDASSASYPARKGLAAPFRRFRLVFVAGLLALSLVTFQAPAVAEGHSLSQTQRSEAQRVVRFAASHLGARFRMGAEGPNYFDCSGLIYRVYKEAGLLNRIGGARLTAAGYYRWFKQRGQISRSNGRVGDLAVWMKNGRISHAGIYIGDGQLISALINPWGVSRTRMSSIVGQRFVAFLKVRLDR